MQWIADHLAIVDLYRQGETDKALERLAQRTPGEQRQMVQRILGVLDVQLKAVEQGLSRQGQIDVTQRRPGVPSTQQSQRPLPGSHRGGNPEFRWNVAATNIAGAVHMEAALRAYRRHDASSARELGEQIELAEGFFEFYELHTGLPTESHRWQLAIGLTAMADGRFGWAATVLSDACARFLIDAPLQLACGSIHETIAMMPANVASDVRSTDVVGQREDNPLTEEDESKPNRFRGSNSALAEAKSARDDRLKNAARAFERALASDPPTLEAGLRLAHVRMMQKNEMAASALLEPIVAARALRCGPRSSRGCFSARSSPAAPRCARRDTVRRGRHACALGPKRIHGAAEVDAHHRQREEEATTVVHSCCAPPHADRESATASANSGFRTSSWRSCDGSAEAVRPSMPVALGCSALALQMLAAAQQPGRFRSSAELVLVDVQVRQGRTPVANLTASDFELRDNGVVQRIQSATFEQVPISALLVLDVSGSVRGETLTHLKAAVHAAATALTEDDQNALLTISDRIVLRSPWSRIVSHSAGPWTR